MFRFSLEMLCRITAQCNSQIWLLNGNLKFIFKCDICAFLSTDFSNFKALFTANHSPSTLWATFDLLGICLQSLIYEVITVPRSRDSMTRWQVDWEGAARVLSLTLDWAHPLEESGKTLKFPGPRSLQVAALGGQPPLQKAASNTQCTWEAALQPCVLSISVRPLLPTF